MPSQIVPALPEVLDSSVWRLAIHADFHLDGSEFAGFTQGIPLVGNAVHVSIRRRVEIADEPFELWGVIGIHDDRGQPQFETLKSQEPSATGMSLHYGFQLRRSELVTERDDENWDTLSARGRELIPLHAARVDYRLRMDPKTAVPAVKLPIRLGEPEVRGFSQINGVRLVQIDTGPPQGELYSAVLDWYAERLNVLVSTRADVRFDDLILRQALERASSVATLAVGTVKREG